MNHKTYDVNFNIIVAIGVISTLLFSHILFSKYANYSSVCCILVIILHSPHNGLVEILVQRSSGVICGIVLSIIGFYLWQMYFFNIPEYMILSIYIFLISSLLQILKLEKRVAIFLFITYIYTWSKLVSGVGGMHIFERVMEFLLGIAVGSLCCLFIDYNNKKYMSIKRVTFTLNLIADLYRTLFLCPMVDGFKVVNLQKNIFISLRRQTGLILYDSHIGKKIKLNENNEIILLQRQIVRDILFSYETLLQLGSNDKIFFSKEFHELQQSIYAFLCNSLVLCCSVGDIEKKTYFNYKNMERVIYDKEIFGDNNSCKIFSFTLLGVSQILIDNIRKLDKCLLAVR